MSQPRTPTRECPWTCRRARGDSGSAVVEVAIMAPVILLLVAFVVFVGRVGSLGQTVQSASRDSARTASLYGNPGSASVAARQIAEQDLADHQVSCANLVVDVDTSDFRPGGTVAVTVTCQVSLSGLSGFPLPGDKQVSARSIEPIDKYAAGQS